MSRYNLFLIILILSVTYGDSSKTVIMKCCPDDKYVGARRHCTSSNVTYNFDEVIVYDTNIVKMKKNFYDVFELVDSKSRNFTRAAAFDVSAKFNPYLIEDGTLMQELPNTYNRFTHISNDNFCIDVALPNGARIRKPTVKFWTILPEMDDEGWQADSLYVATGLIFSSVFMGLVLIVYSLLPELRNLGGMVLMAYVFSLLGAFTMLATLHILIMLEMNEPEICVGFTFVIYYFFQSSFCWMNVMSTDIWWTFRGYAKARPIHRRGENFKFGMYCLYAFGLPALMTFIMGVIDQLNLTHIPWFIKPNLIESGCFIEGGSKFVYLYVPMLIIIILNWTFFLMTAFNIWRLSRGTAVLDSPAAGNPSAHRTHRHRFMLYLKLSMVMGINWLLEVVSFLAPKYRVWYLTDGYNMLVGLFIFLIFVCKKKIYLMLKKKFSQRTQWSPISKSRSASVSSDSEETTQISTSPSGASFYSKQ